MNLPLFYIFMMQKYWWNKSSILIHCLSVLLFMLYKCVKLQVVIQDYLLQHQQFSWSFPLKSDSEDYIWLTVQLMSNYCKKAKHVSQIFVGRISVAENMFKECKRIQGNVLITFSYNNKNNNNIQLSQIWIISFKCPIYVSRMCKTSKNLICFRFNRSKTKT